MMNVNVLYIYSKLGVAFTLLNCLLCSQSQAKPLVDLDASVSWSVIGNPVERWKNQSGDQLDAETAFGAVSYRSSFSSRIGLSGVDFSGGCSQMDLMTPDEADRLLNVSDETGGFAVMIAFTDHAGVDSHESWANLIGNSDRLGAFFIRYNEKSNMLSFALRRGSQIGALADGDSVVVGLNYDADSGDYIAMMVTSSGVTNTVSGIVPAADFSRARRLSVGSFRDGCLDGMISKVLIYDNELSSEDFLGGIKKLEQMWLVPRQKMGLELHKPLNSEAKKPGNRPSEAKLLVDLDASISESVSVSEWKDQSGNQFHATISNGEVRYPSSFSSSTGLSGVDFSGGHNQMDIMTSEESKRLLDFSAGTGGFSVLASFTDSPVSDLQPAWATLIGNSHISYNGFFLRYDDGFGGFYFSLNGGYQIGLIEDGDSVVVGLNYDADTGAFTAMIISSSGGSKTIEGIIPAQDFSTEDALSIGNASKRPRYMEGMIGRVMIYENELSSADFFGEMKRLAQIWVEEKYASLGLILF